MTNNSHISRLDYHGNSLDFLVSIWILCTFILSLSFVSILLGIFSSQKCVPLVQSLDDIMDNKQLSVCGWNSLAQLKYSHPDQFKLLESRCSIDELTKAPFYKIDCSSIELYDIMQFMQDILNSKLVLLYSSCSNDFALGLNQDLVLGEHKYFPLSHIISVDKYHPQKNKIMLGYVLFVLLCDLIVLVDTLY